MEFLFSDSDIKAAFHSFPINKTCGLDRFSAEFFIGSWEIVGAEVTEAVKEFFSSGNLLSQWNTTSLVLIPKITNASKTTEFRPISCLNTVYKVIAADHKAAKASLSGHIPFSVSFFA